ncbi:MAG: hypothetical protein WBB55_01165 [Anaerolineales bacterium]
MIPRPSNPTILGTVPYFASPIAIFGFNCHREHVQSTRSSKGVLSMIEAGATKAESIMRDLPPSTM